LSTWLYRPGEIDCDYTLVELEDLKSLTYISLSLLDNYASTPFIWYDVDQETFVLTLEVNPHEDDRDELLILTLKYPGVGNSDNFLLYSQQDDSVRFSPGFRGIDYQYISIIKTREIPYLSETSAITAGYAPYFFFLTAYSIA
jgi:hypothetical protein